MLRELKEEINLDFNIGSFLGVSKISNMNFSSKQDKNLANTRKIITGITNDVRIILIKLADRLHNMRTLQFKNEFKQKENALETLDIFVPMAYYIRPEERNRGYATKALSLAIKKYYNKYTKKILITYFSDNKASSRIIKKNGGVLEKKVIDDITKREISRYIIKVRDDSLVVPKT